MEDLALYTSPGNLFCFIVVNLALWSPLVCKNGGLLLAEIMIETELGKTFGLNAWCSLSQILEELVILYQRQSYCASACQCVEYHGLPV